MVNITNILWWLSDVKLKLKNKTIAMFPPDHHLHVKTKATHINYHLASVFFSMCGLIARGPGEHLSGVTPDTGNSQTIITSLFCTLN